MKTIDVIYENGVFRPLEPVDLLNRSRWQMHMIEAPPAAEEEDDSEIWNILGRTHDTGDPHLAQRHNEHQP